MANVCIQKDLFPAGESLFEILTMRMASVQWREANVQAAKAGASNAGAASQPIDAFLCSADFAEKQGGMAAIVEMTRSMRAKKLMVIDNDADGQFHVTQEMNGKLIRVAVPAGAETQPTAQNYSLQMAATLLLDEDRQKTSYPLILSL